jgi:hypothetical protein
MADREHLKLLTLTEVAEITGMRFAQVKQLVLDRQLAAIPFGEDYRVPLVAIEIYYRHLAEGTAALPKPKPVPIGRRWAARSTPRAQEQGAAHG